MSKGWIPAPFGKLGFRLSPAKSPVPLPAKVQGVCPSVASPRFEIGNVLGVSSDATSVAPGDDDSTEGVSLPPHAVAVIMRRMPTPRVGQPWSTGREESWEVQWAVGGSRSTNPLAPEELPLLELRLAAASVTPSFSDADSGSMSAQTGVQRAADERERCEDKGGSPPDQSSVRAVADEEANRNRDGTK